MMRGLQFVLLLLLPQVAAAGNIQLTDQQLNELTCVQAVELFATELRFGPPNPAAELISQDEARHMMEGLLPKMPGSPCWSHHQKESDFK